MLHFLLILGTLYDCLSGCVANGGFSTAPVCIAVLGFDYGSGYVTYSCLYGIWSWWSLSHKYPQRSSDYIDTRLFLCTELASLCTSACSINYSCYQRVTHGCALEGKVVLCSLRKLGKLIRCNYFKKQCSQYSLFHWDDRIIILCSPSHSWWESLRSYANTLCVRVSNNYIVACMRKVLNALPSDWMLSLMKTLATYITRFLLRSWYCVSTNLIYFWTE